MVVVALLVHVIDIGLDVLVALLFLTHLKWAFFFGTAGVIIWACLVSSLYVSFGGGGPSSGDIDEGGVTSRLQQFFMNFVQAQIFAEAHSCILHNADTDYFFTLRLLESILESAPNALLQLYALIIWTGADGGAPEDVQLLLQVSVLVSFVSVSLGLAMWEQKVQFRTSSMYVAAVAVMRAFEVASRSLTLAVFAGLTHPWGFWWALLVDYGVMLLLIARHRSVQLTYGVFVAVPLILVSLEPLVWRREDHAVPKDSYYLVRVLECFVMWGFIVKRQSAMVTMVGPVGCEVMALVSTLGLFVMLPFVWRTARRYELSRDVADWGEDGAKGDGLYSDSDLGSSEGSDRAANDDNDGELPPE